MRNGKRAFLLLAQGPLGPNDDKSSHISRLIVVSGVNLSYCVTTTVRLLFEGSGSVVLSKSILFLKGYVSVSKAGTFHINLGFWWSSTICIVQLLGRKSLFFPKFQCSILWLRPFWQCSFLGTFAGRRFAFCKFGPEDLRD